MNTTIPDHAQFERQALINATLAPPAQHPEEIVAERQWRIMVDFECERQSAAIREALDWLRGGAPGRAVETLEKARL